MRALILTAALLALAACKNNDQVDNTQNIDENLTAENIVSNDVTAIDAVTGDAANMAAESSIENIGAANVLDDENASSPTKPVAAKPAAKPVPKRAPATAKPDEPSTSSPPAATTNSAE